MSEYWLEIGVYKGVGRLQQNFHVEGDILHEPFSNGQTGYWMPYKTVFTQRNFQADFLQVKYTFDVKRPFCIFEPPPRFGGIGAS